MRTRTVTTNKTENNLNFINVDYSNELKEDNKFHEIKSFCFLYINDKSVADEKSVADINDMFNYVENTFHYLSKMRDTFKLDYHSNLLTSISKSIDTFILSGNFETLSYENRKSLLSKEMTLSLELYGFCHQILKSIIDEKQS